MKRCCPECRKLVAPTHFACASGRKGGASVTGARKRRGGPEYYRALSRKAVGK